MYIVNYVKNRDKIFIRRNYTQLLRISFQLLGKRITTAGREALVSHNKYGCRKGRFDLRINCFKNC